MNLVREAIAGAEPPQRAWGPAARGGKEVWGRKRRGASRVALRDGQGRHCKGQDPAGRRRTKGLQCVHSAACCSLQTVCESDVPGCQPRKLGSPVKRLFLRPDNSVDPSIFFGSMAPGAPQTWEPTYPETSIFLSEMHFREKWLKRSRKTKI